MAVRSIGGTQLPFTVTIQQLFATAITLIVLFFTRNTWSVWLPSGGLQVGMVAGPMLAAVVTRDQQIQGRSLPRYLRSLLLYLLTANADRLKRLTKKTRDVHMLAAVRWDET